MREICVVGGNRYFGKRLIGRLTAAGDRVTVVHRGSSAPPAGTAHLIADRDDEASLDPRQGRLTRRGLLGGRPVDASAPAPRGHTMTPADSSISRSEALCRSASKARCPPRRPNRRLARAM